MSSPVSYTHLDVYKRQARVRHSADLQQGLGHLIGGTDDLRVRLEVTLGADHLDQLFGQLDVGQLQRAGADQAQAGGARLADDRLAGGGGLHPRRITDRTQTLLVAEIRQSDHGLRLGLAVAVATEDGAILADIHADQAAAGKTVLGDRIGAGFAAELSGAGEIQTHGQRRGGATVGVQSGQINRDGERIENVGCGRVAVVIQSLDDLPVGVEGDGLSLIHI